jgi:2-polyprenyl-3-methyl-5-hydroxy-6-metoxy-1,4-benzoquinol methylase
MAKYREARRLKTVFELPEAVRDMGRRPRSRVQAKKATTLSIEHPKDIFKLLEPAMRGKVLDVGIGAGPLAKRMLLQGAQVYGVDLSRPLLKRVRRRGAIPVQALGQKMPFRTGSFDSAISIDVIGHVKKPGPLIAEMKRVLKPGGTMVFNVVEKDALHPKNSFTPRQLEELVKRKGLILEGGSRLIISPKPKSARFLFVYARKKPAK